MTVLDWALWMLEQFGRYGLKVLPLNGKDPWTKHPHAPKHAARDATSEPDQLRRWWRAGWKDVALPNYGVTGLLHLDVDPRHGGSVAALEALLGGPLPRTFRVRSGGEDQGEHLYLLCSRLLRGGTVGTVDVRADGLYVVGPGSTHPETGNQYLVLDSAAPAAAPASLEAALAAKGEKGSKGKGCSRRVPATPPDGYATWREHHLAHAPEPDESAVGPREASLSDLSDEIRQALHDAVGPTPDNPEGNSATLAAGVFAALHRGWTNDAIFTKIGPTPAAVAHIEDKGRDPDAYWWRPDGELDRCRRDFHRHMQSADPAEWYVAASQHPLAATETRRKLIEAITWLAERHRGERATVGSVPISKRKLAVQAGCAENTARRGLADLEDAGLLVKATEALVYKVAVTMGMLPRTACYLLKLPEQHANSSSQVCAKSDPFPSTTDLCGRTMGQLWHTGPDLPVGAVRADRDSQRWRALGVRRPLVRKLADSDPGVTVPMEALADWLDRPRRTAYRWVDRLEADGIVERLDVDGVRHVRLTADWEGALDRLAEVSGTAGARRRAEDRMRKDWGDLLERFGEDCRRLRAERRQRTEKAFALQAAKLAPLRRQQAEDIARLPINERLARAGTSDVTWPEDRPVYDLSDPDVPLPGWLRNDGAHPMAVLALKTAGPYVGRQQRIEDRADRLLPLADNVTLPLAPNRFEIVVRGAARQPRRCLRLSVDFTVPPEAVDVLPDLVSSHHAVFPEYLFPEREVA